MPADRKTTILKIGMLSLAMFASVALAGHSEPGKAKKMQLALVNGFQFCASNCSDSGPTNTATMSGNLPACTPAVAVDFCALSPTGSGMLSAQLAGSAAKGNQDIKLAAVVSGLNSFC